MNNDNLIPTANPPYLRRDTHQPPSSPSLTHEIYRKGLNKIYQGTLYYISYLELYLLLLK